MKIAYIHFHLKTGGVTTVMRQQVQAVKGRSDVLVLTGEASDTPFPAETVVIPELGYDGLCRQPESPVETAHRVHNAILAKWRDGCDLIHVHNPTLAKNNRFLKILKALQALQIPLFLQIHDFAEDGRSSAYFSEEYVSNCHYGVINSRDYHILLKSGLTDEGLHIIHNTINPIPVPEQRVKTENRVLYPVRAIRRKNIGEAILVSLYLNPDGYLSVTLPPNSPKDIVIYEYWKAFVSSRKLRVRFEEGIHHEFDELVATSRFLITTSINEGFGFSFLEPWTAGKPLWGRRLPDICRDFEDKGIRLTHLYDRLAVPLDWIGKHVVLERWLACIRQTESLYGYDFGHVDLKSCFDEFTRNETIDFALLDEGFQSQIIQRLISEPNAHEQMKTLNPYLEQPGKVIDENDLIRHNREIIQKHYTAEKYRDTLMRIYKKVKSLPVRQKIDKRKLLNEFIDPMNFSLIKWCD